MSGRKAGRTVFVLALGTVGLLVLLALLAPWVAPYGPQARGIELLADPGPDHLLGTDQQGRDILTLLLFGSRVALLVGFGATLLSMTLGIPLGLISGYKGGAVDSMIMGICEVVFSFPGILLAILLVFITQSPSVVNVMVALSATGWAGWARLVRGQVLQERTRDYVLMARTAGAGTPRILFRHILPNTVSVLLVQFSFAVGSALLAESSLSFLGLGPQDLPSWGSLLSEGAALFVCSPWMATFSGLAIFVSVLSFNVIGDRLRDRFAQPDLASTTGTGGG
jgi:peptide/nickel transport system permease protein